MGRIEIRTKRFVAMPGERTRLACCQRRPRRWHLRDARAQKNSVVIAQEVRREGAPNRSRGGCAPRESQLSAVHFQPYFCFISAWICSQGIPRSGCFDNSSARRSISSICSGVGSGSYPFSTMFSPTRCASSIRSSRLNFASISAFRVFQAKTPSGIGGAFQPWKPSMNSSQRRCESSTRSSNGSSFAAAKNFSKDMDSNYIFGTLVQVEIFAFPTSSFIPHPSSFPPA